MRLRGGIMRRVISLVGGSAVGDEGICCIVLGEGRRVRGEKADWNYVMIGMICSFILF